MGEAVTRYYISLDVADKPGVLAAVAHDVRRRTTCRIETVRQDGHGDEAALVVRHPHARPTPRCPRPSSELRELDVVRAVARVMRVEGELRPVTRAPHGARTSGAGVIEEYRDRLPVTDATPVVTLREGGTPLVPAPTLSERTGCEVYLKVEGANPTGSFKDRGMTMAISKAAEEGAQAVICASTGNTSASAPRRTRCAAGMVCAVLVPDGKIALGQDVPGARPRRAAAAGRRQLRRLPDPRPRAGRALPGRAGQLA